MIFLFYLSVSIAPGQRVNILVYLSRLLASKTKGLKVCVFLRALVNIFRLFIEAPNNELIFDSLVNFEFFSCRSGLIYFLLVTFFELECQLKTLANVSSTQEITVPFSGLHFSIHARPKNIAH